MIYGPYTAILLGIPNKPELFDENLEISISDEKRGMPNYR